MTSFQNLHLWIEKIIENSLIEMPTIMILGNKCDLTTKEVMDQDVNPIISKFQLDAIIFFRQVSARTGLNLEESFVELGERLVD